MTTHPEILWAQRSSESAEEKNVVFLTVNLPDIIESTLQYDLKPSSLVVNATAGTGEQKNYEFSLNFFADVVPEQSIKRLTSRSLIAVLRKKELKSEYWPRLTKEKVKTPYIKTDFSKWVDEDEQDGNPSVDDDMVGGIPGMDDGFGGMDFSKMMSQMGSSGGPSDLGASAAEEDDADSDSDGDGPPPLEDAEPAA
ncbi:HSP20-like chaperone [Phlebopus sp. FC_14]|nr:HSP20-like chaperone [Phlebopus sp. FC_14]